VVGAAQCCLFPCTTLHKRNTSIKPPKAAAWRALTITLSRSKPAACQQPSRVDKQLKAAPPPQPPVPPSRLPPDEERAPLKIELPEGPLIGLARERLPVVVGFVAAAPMGFTARVEFLDEVGGPIHRAVAGCGVAPGPGGPPRGGSGGRRRSDSKGDARFAHSRARMGCQRIQYVMT
jgi:hypothetical protein